MSRMKIRELIEVLGKLDPEWLAVVEGYDGGYHEVGGGDMFNLHVVGAHVSDDEWYYGKLKCGDGAPNSVCFGRGGRA